MARQNGRDIRIKKGTDVIAVLNTKTINFNNTPVDVTGDSDDGFITVLSRPGTRQITMDCSGYSENEILRDIAVSGDGLLDTYTVEYLSADGAGDVIYTITGQFYFATFSETGASDGAIEFTANFQSSGEYQKVVASS